MYFRQRFNTPINCKRLDSILKYNRTKRLTNKVIIVISGNLYNGIQITNQITTKQLYKQYLQHEREREREISALRADILIHKSNKSS